MHPTRHRHYDGTARRKAQDSHQVAERMLPMQTETYQSTCPHSILSLRPPANHSVPSDMLPLPQQMVPQAQIPSATSTGRLRSFYVMICASILTTFHSAMKRAPAVEIVFAWTFIAIFHQCQTATQHLHKTAQVSPRLSLIHIMPKVLKQVRLIPNCHSLICVCCITGQSRAQSRCIQTLQSGVSFGR